MQEGTGIPRRALLQGAAVLGASALAGSVLSAAAAPAYAQDDGEASVVPDGVQYGFLVRMSNCVNCQECVKACRRANGTPEEVPARRKVTRYQTKSETVFVSTSCMHCEHPACIDVCPAKAISKGAGGSVTVDHDRCIGCKYCYQACPFGVPHYTSEGMDKCDFCLGNGVKLGDEPHCAQACKFRALSFGTMEELMSGSGGRARQVESPAGPSCLLV